MVLTQSTFRQQLRAQPYLEARAGPGYTFIGNLSMIPRLMFTSKHNLLMKRIRQPTVWKFHKYKVRFKNDLRKVQLSERSKFVMLNKMMWPDAP